jgi:hypothetical protein
MNGRTGLQYGATGTCQECKTKTPFRIASAGSFVVPKQWSISHAKAHALYESASLVAVNTNKSVWKMDPAVGHQVRTTEVEVRFACRRCHGSSDVAMWIDLGNDKFLGPFCKICALNAEIGHAEEGGDPSTCPIYVLRFGKGVARTIRLFKKAIEVRAQKIAERKAKSEDIQLF